LIYIQAPESCTHSDILCFNQLILLLMNGDDISDVFKTGLIPFEIHQSLICSANSRSDIPLSSFSMLEKCRLLILEPVSIFVNHNDVAGIH
jgi:hypothetical protein